MLFGHLLVARLTVVSPKILGALTLMAIGVYQLVQAIKNRVSAEKAVPAMAAAIAEAKAGTDAYTTLISIKLNIFGLVIQVLRTPHAADLDGSGTISVNESVILGLALALDTFAAGMAVTMTGIPLYVIGMVAVLQVLMIWTGQIFTGKLPAAALSKVKYLPGFVLIAIGALKLL